MNIQSILLLILVLGLFMVVSFFVFKGKDEKSCCDDCSSCGGCDLHKVK